MSEIKVKYECPICNRDYDTREEAESCLKPLYERFKPGDIIRGGYGYGCTVYRIWKPERLDKRAAASLERVDEYRIAKGWEKKRDGLDRCYMIGGFWCHAEKYDIKEAKKLVSDLKKRLKAAEAFLEMVKETHKPCQ